jgi:hypothetical protein
LPCSAWPACGAIGNARPGADMADMPPPHVSARGSAVVAAVINAVLNPLIEKVLNPGGFQPLSAVLVNLAITSVIMCVLVAVFARRGVGYGLRYGISAAAIVLACGVLVAGLGVAGLAFPGLLWLKAGYCGALAYLVAR